MPNDLIPFDQFQAPSTVFKGSSVDVAKFMGGIQASFAILTIKGKEWGIRYRGNTQQLTAPNPMAGNALMPVQFLDVVIVDAAESISKVYYIHGYKEGERTPPDCWSANGVVPDPASPHIQNKTCRGCQHNVFGSKIGDGGQKGKACPDNKRLAIVPLTDIMNEAFGGPVMLRLPPGSFSLYAEFVGKMASRQYPPYAVACRLTFAPNEAYPRVMFTPIRPLNDNEAQQVLEVQKNPALERMLTDPAIGAFADAEADADGVVHASSAVPPPPVTQTSNVQPTVTLADQQRVADLEAQLAAARAAAVQPAAPPPPAQSQQPSQTFSTPVQTGFGVAAPPAGPVASQPAPGGAWGATPGASAPAAQTAPAAPNPTQGDDMTPPAFLRRSEVAATQPLPPPVGQPVLTPEQMKIKELEAQLAAATSAKPPRKPRQKPVSPGATEPVSQVTNGATQHVTPPGNPQPQGEQPVAGDATVGNAIADRIASLVKG